MAMIRRSDRLPTARDCITQSSRFARSALFLVLPQIVPFPPALEFRGIEAA